MDEMPPIPPLAPDAPVLRKKPQKKMTEADKDMVVQILMRPDARVNGKIHIPTIAAMTGLSYNQITSVIDSDRYFKAQKAEATPDKLVPSEGAAMDPEVSLSAPGVTITQEEFEKMRSLLRQQRKMDKGDWEGLGMNGAMAERAGQLIQLGMAPLLPIMNLVNGGLIKHHMVLEKMLEEDGERISKSLLPPEQNAKGEPVEDGKKQRDWRYCWYAGYKLLLDLQKSLHQNQATIAKAMRDMQAANAGGPKKPEKGVYEVETTPAKPNPHAA